MTGFNRQLGISDEWFAIGDSLILTVLAQVSAFLPALSFSKALCCDSIVMHAAVLESVFINALTA